ERLQDVGDRARATEEDRRVLELERCEAAERRALLPDVARFGSAGGAARQLPLDQAAQVVLQQDLEVARRRERMERRDQRAFGAVVEPLLDELVELLLLRQAL